MIGFITIDRSIFDHPMFKRAPMSQREAFIWMISRAAWTDTKHRVGAEIIVVSRGSFVCTLRELQAQFMWDSDKKVRTFLKDLEINGIINRTVIGTKNAQKTHVSICNYDKYQSSGRTKDADARNANSTSPTGRTKVVENKQENGDADEQKTHGGRSEDAIKKEGNKRTKEVDKSTSSQEVENYQRFLDHHPKPIDSTEGFEAFQKLISQGVSGEMIVASAKAYAAIVKKWSSDGKIQQSDNFLDEHRGKWRDHIPKPKREKTTPASHLEFVANQLNAGRFISPSSIRPDQARAMIQAGLVTSEFFKEKGIQA
jgi:hypothetical protein